MQEGCCQLTRHPGFLSPEHITTPGRNTPAAPSGVTRRRCVESDHAAPRVDRMEGTLRPGSAVSEGSRSSQGRHHRCFPARPAVARSLRYRLGESARGYNIPHIEAKYKSFVAHLWVASRYLPADLPRSATSPAPYSHPGGTRGNVCGVGVVRLVRCFASNSVAS